MRFTNVLCWRKVAPSTTNQEKSMNGLTRMELQRLEDEAQRLRAEYADDPLARAVISLDHFVRRLALRLALA